ncbi:hypothetical protein AVO45_13850 [Ruegeria marisrubri]|uniref:Methyltransferase FkbM domain-containing protein n=2 Tax=Ruegeria marisrubri TaxID=1685379 RepID=A0A0X3TD12_9RHOB|nr:hypothetical protein AVO45_13850 [Ruegeria marisrubri]
MVENEGDIPLITGDALLAGEKFDMIKIDVEGMEMKVLNGMENLLRRTKPKLFVEVDRQNFKAFDDFCATHNYEVLEQFKRYRPNTNFLLGPRLE